MSWGLLFQLSLLLNVGSFVSSDLVGIWPFSFFMPAPFRTASVIQKGQAALCPLSVHGLALHSAFCVCYIFISFTAGFCLAIWFLLRFESGDEL